MAYAFLFIGEQTAWSNHLDDALSSIGNLWVVQESILETAISQRKYDLALIDANHVPNVPKLITRLRRQQTNMHVVVVSRTRQWKRAQEALEAGATNYILKLEDSRKIREEIRSTLEKPLPILQSNQHNETSQNAQNNQVELTILMADNAEMFVKTRAEFLKREGYKVVLAFNPSDAKRLLENGGIDLAVLDIRMTDDDDDDDMSGLILAKTVAPSIPKIILTGFPTTEHVRQALSGESSVGGTPPAVRFLSKKDGTTILMNSIFDTVGKLHEDKTTPEDAHSNTLNINHPKLLPKKTPFILFSSFVFVIFPKAIGRFILDMLGRDKATDVTATILGYIVILLVVLIIQGVINPSVALNTFKDTWNFFFPSK